MYKNQIKASILLIVTLLLGLILGGLGSQYLIENRFEQMAKMRYPDGFVNVFEQIIDPKGRMKFAITWVLKCPACDNEEPVASRNIECPVCGTEMRRKAASRKRIHNSK